MLDPSVLRRGSGCAQQASAARFSLRDIKIKIETFVYYRKTVDMVVNHHDMP